MFTRASKRVVLTAGLLGVCLLAARAQQIDPRVLEAENQRIAVVEKVKPSVVAIFAHGGQGGGSGVLIDKDGYALTNFHVVEGSGPIMQCGLPDGILYDAVVVGLDKVGDVALIKLLPKKPGQEFPFTPMGDSDKVRQGDWTLCMGNPFLLATDFQPTVTYGMVSGVHRYQYPAGTLLEYTDCIQVDTSINPGNSGGPLFSMNAELIGINGRISIEKRGRVNSGVGYAISINQIKNFLGHLRAGLDTDHATLGASITTEKEGEEGVGERLIVSEVLENSDVARRGISEGDELVSFAGRPMTSVNQYKNVLGLFPKDWRVPLVYRHENKRHETLVRLMKLQKEDINPQVAARPGPQPRPAPRPAPASPAAKLYEAKPGFANYYFNKQERDRLVAAFRKHGDFAPLASEWALEGEVKLAKRTTDFRATVRDEKAAEGKGTRTMVRLSLGGVNYPLEPLKTGQDVQNLLDPPGSGGLLMALYHYRRLLTAGPAGFERHVSHGGREPFYPPPADGTTPKTLGDLRVDAEVLRTEHGSVPVKWYFSTTDQTLLGFEVKIQENDDPCEVYLSDYKPVDGRALPHRIEVVYKGNPFGVFTVKNYQLAPGK